MNCVLPSLLVFFVDTNSTPSSVVVNTLFTLVSPTIYFVEYQSSNALIVASNFHIPKKTELVSTGQKTKSGKSVVKAPSGIKFFDEYVYYDVQGPGTYYRYDQDRDILIPLDIK